MLSSPLCASAAPRSSAKCNEKKGKGVEGQRVEKIKRSFRLDRGFGNDSNFSKMANDK